MQEKNYEFFNFPKKFDSADYVEVTDLIIKKYSKIKGLLSIYNWGDPSVFGISDIDIVFVFKDEKSKPLPVLKRSFYLLNAKARYLVRHPFIFINEESFRNLRLIYPNANPKLLFGKIIKINDLTKTEVFYSKVSMLNDIIIRHYPRDFIDQFASKRINVRDTLLRLNSLKYTIRTLEDLTNKKNQEWANKLHAIKNLRGNWFKTKNFDLLVSLNKDCAYISMEIIENFAEFLRKSGLLKLESVNDVLFNGMKNLTIFTREWEKNKALKYVMKNIQKNKKVQTMLPVELSAQLFEYSKSKGPISNHIRNNLVGSLKYDLKHKKVVENRINILNSQAELALDLKHSDFPAFFDFGYRNKSGINNALIGIYDRIK